MSSSSTFSICSVENCWWPSRVASDCADWMKPRARSCIFQYSSFFPQPAAPPIRHGYGIFIGDPPGRIDVPQPAAVVVTDICAGLGQMWKDLGETEEAFSQIRVRCLGPGNPLISRMSPAQPARIAGPSIAIRSRASPGTLRSLRSSPARPSRPIAATPSRTAQRLRPGRSGVAVKGVLSDADAQRAAGRAANAIRRIAPICSPFARAAGWPPAATSIPRKAAPRSSLLRGEFLL